MLFFKKEKRDKDWYMQHIIDGKNFKPSLFYKIEGYLIFIGYFILFPFILLYDFLKFVGCNVIAFFLRKESCSFLESVFGHTHIYGFEDEFEAEALKNSQENDERL